mmetsp:Transcript_74137/g.173997  ORF Transcript_74137/g.173997 Transcript_74137/m.173997 type:complete len:269 (-) Transcript_74137:195-1001(-)
MHWSTQASSSIYSTTCDTAITQDLTCFQVLVGAAKTALRTLKRVGMKASSRASFSAHCWAIRSRFSSPIPTRSSSMSSSSSLSALEVQVSTFSSTSNIHSRLSKISCSRNGWPSALQKSAQRPSKKDIAASMALCRTCASPQWLALHISSSSGQTCCRPFSLKNSGSSSAAEINDSRVSFRISSCSDATAKPFMTVKTVGINAPIGPVTSFSKSSTICRANRAAAPWTSADGAPRQVCSIVTACGPCFRSSSPTSSTMSCSTCKQAAT